LTEEPERDDERPAPSLSPFRRILFVVLFLGLLFLFALAVKRAPAGSLRRLSEARPLPVFLGVILYALAFLSRAVRLNLLLPRDERLPLLKAASLSAAATFLLQVIPFRGGEVAGWAAYRKALGSGWARAGAVFALVKVVDSACVLLVGLGGAVVMASRRSAPILATWPMLLAGAAALTFLSLPRLTGGLLLRLSSRARPGGRLERISFEVGRTLVDAAASPSRYALAVLWALAFLAVYVGAMVLVCDGLGISASAAGLAFAALTAISAAAVLPSPAGTFGPNESGFAAGLAVDGIALATGVVTGALLHVLFTATAGLVGLPFLLGAPRRADQQVK
jgi:uncharacterized membrane protein YbhN (UPF0104 family)